MDELKFVFRCFLFTCLLFAVSQYKTENGQTVEAQIRGYLVSSSVANFVNESAQGGAKAIRRISNDALKHIDQNKVVIQSKPIHSAVQPKHTQIEPETDIDLE